MGYNWDKSDSWLTHSWCDRDWAIQQHNSDKFLPYRDRPGYYNFLYNNKQGKYYNRNAGYYYRDSNKFYKFYQYINGSGQNNYYEDTYWEWCHTSGKWVVWEYDDITFA